MRRGIVILGWLLIPFCAWAGEQIDLKLSQPVALPHLATKSLVAEFVDPEETRLGPVVANILGGELLDAVADLSGAGVLVATDREHQGIVRRLGDDYHHAAVQIAVEQKAMLAAWGVIEEAEDGLLLSSFVSQVPDSVAVKLQIMWEGEELKGFAADISSRAFHFTSRAVTKGELFKRRLILKGPRDAFEAPNRASRRVESLIGGASLMGDTLVDGWWRVRLSDGRWAWIQHHPDVVRIPPRVVEIEAMQITTFATPGAQTGAVKRPLHGHFEVQDARYTASGTWLRIVIPARAGTAEPDRPRWIRASDARARYTLPFVHFVAGLYRYRLKKYGQAARDFDTFIRQADAEDNVTTSAAYQLQGLSRLAASPRDPDALKPFDQAVRLTPFDARAYSMKALAGISASGEVGNSSIDDLGTALRLNPKDRAARNLVFGMKHILANPTTAQGRYGRIGAGVIANRERVARLHERAAATRDTLGW